MEEVDASSMLYPFLDENLNVRFCEMRINLIFKKISASYFSISCCKFILINHAFNLAYNSIFILFNSIFRMKDPSIFQGNLFQ